MALPRTQEACLLYQSAWQRLDDAQFLLKGMRTTGAMYLAGYSIECMLKALILEMSPDGERAETLASFRGSRAHDYGWLKDKYFHKGGPGFPSSVSKNFVLVNTWTTDLRYKGSKTNYGDAEAFLRAAEVILSWADGRL